MGLFGQKYDERKNDPKHDVRKWKRELRSQERSLDKQIRSIEREEVKVKKAVKEAAKKGDASVTKMLAKELVRSRKAKSRIYTSKAKLHSVTMHMENNLATIKMMGNIEKSGELMGLMNNLIKVPQIAGTMREMGREMEKAGFIEELVDETLEMDSEELEDAAEEEISKVLEEIFASAGPAPKEPVPQTNTILVEEGEEEEDESAMRARLDALKT